MARFIEKVDEQGRRYIDDYFVYNTIVASLANGVSTTNQIQIEANSDFRWEKTSYFAALADAAQTDSGRVIPLVRVAVTDSGSGRNLQNTAVDINSIAGNAGLPFILPVTRIFTANSVVSFTFTNYSAATTYTNIGLSLIGYKRFYF